jgi:hypothetical protein
MRPFLYLLLIGFALFVFNPDEDDFAAHVEKRSGEFFSSKVGDTKLSEILSDLGAGVTKALAGHVTERNNFFLFSIYTIDLDGEEADEDEWRFLGIATKFVTLKKPEGIEE